MTAITCDADGGYFGRLLEWEDTAGQPRKWAMPMEMLSGSGEELRRVLLVNGLSYISTTGEARARLMEYISLCKPERKVTCVNKTGWHGSVYVLQDEVIGEGAEGVILQTASVQGRDFRLAGSLDEWRDHIGRYCIGNPRVAFAVSLAFAAPLLRLVGMDGGGYHLKGESNDGKTTTMKAATSVCGGPDYWHTWRSTGNALEGTASRRNDAAMMLDEIREVDGREAGNIAYMLANGQGKGRAGTDGELATGLGLTGWPEGEAMRATQACLKAWIGERGHSANQEDMAAVDQVRGFFSANQYSRFADWHDDHNRPSNMVGYRRVERGNHATGTDTLTTFYVMPSGWKEICKGFDARKVAKLCAISGYLLPAKDGKMQIAIRPPEMNVKKLYVFNSDVVG